MLIFCPYTHMRPETADALNASGYSWYPVPLFRDTSYCEFLTRIWALKVDFVTVEHDIVVTPDTLLTMEHCGHGLCGAVYQYLEHDDFVGLGCMKFSAEFRKQQPDLMREIGKRSNGEHSPGHWCTLDGHLKQIVEERKLPKYRHSNLRVTHLSNGKPGHGCDGWVWE